MTYCVYILCNKPRGTLYVGSTADLPLRLWQHRSGAKRNSFTARYNLNCLVYVEAHDDMEPARVREYRIKRWRREWKFALIEAQNPDWHDLSDRLL